MQSLIAAVSQSVTTNKSIPSFFAGRMPFLSPNQQCQSTERKLNALSGGDKCRWDRKIAPLPPKDALPVAHSIASLYRGTVRVRRWVQLRVDFDSTGIRPPFDCSSTQSWSWVGSVHELGWVWSQMYTNLLRVGLGPNVRCNDVFDSIGHRREVSDFYGHSVLVVTNCQQSVRISNYVFNDCSFHVYVSAVRYVLT